MKPSDPSKTLTMARAHLLIEGRVQGVGFRFSAIAEARRLGLCGWIRNTPDGAVELEAQGPSRVMTQFEAWCHEGPSMAHVTAVHRQDLAPKNDLPDRFDVRW